MNVLRSSRGWRALAAPTSLRACRVHPLTSHRLVLRSFQHLAQNSDKEAPKSTTQATQAAAPKPPPPPTPPKSTSDDAVHISLKQQRKNDWEIIKRLSGNLWPKDDWSTRGRVVVGMGFLVAGKVRLQT